MNLYTPALEPALAEYEEALALWKADRCQLSRLFEADEEMLHASRPYASELRLVAQGVRSPDAWDRLAWRAFRIPQGMSPIVARFAAIWAFEPLSVGSDGPGARFASAPWAKASRSLVLVRQYYGRDA